MSILKVDTINEKTSGNGVAIPGHAIQVVDPTAGALRDSHTSWLCKHRFAASQYSKVC